MRQKCQTTVIYLIVNATVVRSMDSKPNCRYGMVEVIEEVDFGMSGP